MKLPRTIRLDTSDAHVFANPAEPGEWAVTGTFSFSTFDPSSAETKSKLAFQSGWMGLSSFGYSTLVQVTVVPETEMEAAVRALAAHLFADYGAPDMLAATEAAKQEIKDAASLCDHPAATLLAIERQLTEDGIAERVRVLPSPDEDGNHARIWSLVPDEE